MLQPKMLDISSDSNGEAPCSWMATHRELFNTPFSDFSFQVTGYCPR